MYAEHQARRAASESTWPDFDSRCEVADHERARDDATYLLNAKDWPSRETPISAKMVGNLARAYIELEEEVEKHVRSSRDAERMFHAAVVSNGEIRVKHGTMRENKDWILERFEDPIKNETVYKVVRTV